jgi:hypothetical protein
MALHSQQLQTTLPASTQEHATGLLASTLP